MDEEDSCRICRSGPEPGSPLYYPCKCTGSIRFCHQDCLVEWLQHSRKKYCELCNHAFVFHKKYRHDMPANGQMPRYLYARRLVVRTANLSVLAARAVLVAATWLAVLPYININIWRFLFWSADVATWMLVPGAEPPLGFLPDAAAPTNATMLNSTASDTTPLFRHSAAWWKEFLKAFSASLAHDCFQGQILSCVIVVVFVGVFLLREWILQNIPQHLDPPPEPIQPPLQLLNREEPFQHWPEQAPEPAPPAEPSVEDLRQARLRRFDAPPQPEERASNEEERREQFLTDIGWASAREDSPSHEADALEASTNAAWREEWEEPETGQQREARVRHFAEHLHEIPRPTLEPFDEFLRPAADEPVADGTQDTAVEDEWQDETDDDEPVAHVHRHGAAAGDAPAEFPPPVADADLDGNDPELEAGFAEEMDGILEAVGMRGPLFGIVQNLCLMLVLCTFVMLTCLTLPYIAGKLLGSGLRLVQMVALPIKLLRLVTDPVFDFLIGVGTKSVGPKMASVAGWKAPESTAQPGQLAAFVTRITSLGTSSVKAKTASSASYLDKMLPASVRESTQWKAIGSHFEVALATGLRGTLHNMGDWFMQAVAALDAHTAGNSTIDRVFCVAFGHGYWLLVLLIHQYFSQPDLQAAIASQSAFKLFMDQHVLLIKAVSFIFIELAVFPLGCGLLLDICVMPLFSDASIWNWPEQIRYAPISFAFVRWMGGSIYMFVFAQYVSATRKVLRPGVLCWIRDPNDPNFHPIKDILDKKSIAQLRKIGASAVMYAGILVASLGVNTYFLRYSRVFPGVLPLRWQPLSTLTEVPLDLIAVHMVMPWAMRLVDPEEVSEWALKLWWQSASRMLRLSSYMIGGEFPDEQTTQPDASSWVERVLRVGAPETRAASHGGGKDGGLCRVPADDKALTTGPLIIPVNADGSPADDKAADAVHKQEEQMQKQTVKATYTNLYLPPDHHRRITLILVLLWLTHCALLIFGLTLPLLMGRKAVTFCQKRFGSGTAHEIHDFYSFLLGVSLFSMEAKLCKLGRKLWTRALARSRRLGTPPYGFVLVGLARKASRLGSAAVLLAGVAGLTPLVVGLVVDQYVIVPLRYDASEVPRVQLWQTWALGLLELRLAVYLIRFCGVPSSGALKWFMDGADQVVRRGIGRPRLRTAYTRIVLPITLLGSAMLIAPVLTADILASKHIVTPPATREEEQVLLRKVFGAVQSTLMILGVRAAIVKRMESWTDILKDEVFLESTELKNYEPAKTLRHSAAHDEYYHAEGPLPDILFRAP